MFRAENQEIFSQIGPIFELDRDIYETKLCRKFQVDWSLRSEIIL